MKTQARNVSFVAALFALALGSFVSRPAAAFELKVSDDYFAKLDFLMQPQVQLSHDPKKGPEGGPDLASDFFVRRTRLLLFGQVSKWVSFFFETDSPNWGKAGKWTPEFYVQDAFVTFNVDPAFRVDVGMLLLPFIHQARQGAINLHTLDYHTELIKYPVGSQKVWRDMGVEVRGIVSGLDYRFAITNGVAFNAGDAAATPAVAPMNLDDIPRFSGRLAWNFFDVEDGFFYGGTYLGKKKVLAIGAAFDVQPEAFGKDTMQLAIGGDVFFDLPMGGNRLSGQAAFVFYGGDGNPNEGMGALFDIGYAFGDWEPILAVDWFKPEAASDFEGHFLGTHLGLNWWMQGHNANIKLDIGLIKDKGRAFGDASIVGTIQTQLFF